MKIIDRFTRDRVSRFLWGAFSVAFLVLLLLAVQGGRQALDREVQAAQDRAVRYTETVLFGSLEGDNLAAPVTGGAYRDLVIAVQGGIMTDPRVARVRVWAADGTLVFSTDGQKSVTVTASDTEPIDGAVKGDTSSQVAEGTVAAKSTLTGTETTLYQTYAPLRVRDRTSIQAASEIDQYYTAISDAAVQPWRALQIAFAVGLFLSLVLLLLSLRRATSLVGAGVGIAAPAGSEERKAADATNILRMRNELERAKEENRRLAQKLEDASIAAGPAPGTGAVGGVTHDDAAAEAHLAEVRDALTTAGTRAAELELALAAAEARAAEAEARVEAEAARSNASTVDPAVLASLEARVVAAEQRAHDAERRLGELSSSRPEAGDEGTPLAADPDPDAGAAEEAPPIDVDDLRRRLARTAARKRLGSHVDDEPGA